MSEHSTLTRDPSTHIHDTPRDVFNYLSQHSRPSSPARPRLPPLEPQTPAPGLQGSRLLTSSKDKIKSFVNLQHSTCAGESFITEF